jgi:hypothetical protein
MKVDAVAACGVLDKALALVGRPDIDGQDPIPGRLRGVLHATGQAVIAESEAKLSEMAVHFIEMPSYRLAGAEEAIRQLTAKLSQTLEMFEHLLYETEKQVTELYGRLLPLIGSLEGFTPRKGSAAADVLDLLRTYPRKRYQALVLESVVTVYRTLLANTPEYLREVNFCRVRLGELCAAIVPPVKPQSELSGPGQHLLPAGCRTLDEAAEQFLARLAPDEVHVFEHALQAQVRKHFRALVTLCLDNNPQYQLVRDVVFGQVRAFLEARLERANPAEVFFRFRPHSHAAQRDIAQAYDEAAPEPAGPRLGPGAEAVLIGVPGDEFGKRFCELARQTLPVVELAEAANDGDLVFYREQSALALIDLPQFSLPAREAYLTAATPEVPTFHARRDISWQSPGV